MAASSAAPASSSAASDPPFVVHKWDEWDVSVRLRVDELPAIVLHESQKPHRSPPFECGDVKWRLAVYPRSAPTGANEIMRRAADPRPRGCRRGGTDTRDFEAGGFDVVLEMAEPEAVPLGWRLALEAVVEVQEPVRARDDDAASSKNAATTPRRPRREHPRRREKTPPAANPRR